MQSQPGATAAVPFEDNGARAAEPKSQSDSREVGAARMGGASRRGRSKHTSIIYLWDLLYALVMRDIKTRYEGTILGFAWMLAKPFLFVGVFFFVFEKALSIDTPRFTSFTLIGMLVYAWFQTGLVGAASIAFSNRELIRRPQFPVAVLPLVAVLSNLVHFLYSLPFLFVILLLGGTKPTLTLFALPLVLIVQFVLTAGLAYIAAAGSILFRDIAHLLEVVLSAFFFLTPIFYEVSRVPEQFHAIYRLNPLVPVLESYRNPLLRGVPPDWSALAAVAAIALACAIGGYLLFRRVSHRFVEEL